MLNILPSQSSYIKKFCWGFFGFFYRTQIMRWHLFPGRHLDQPCHHKEDISVSLPACSSFKKNGTQNELDLPKSSVNAQQRMNIPSQPCRVTQRNEKRLTARNPPVYNYAPKG